MAAGRCAKPCSRRWRSLGLRPAEPGEFTRRAVENGRLDLTRAEAIADLVDAETPAQLRQALRQYDGALAALYEGWRAALIAALGRAEAAIDFSDDGVGETEFAAARAGSREDHRGNRDSIWTIGGAAKRCAKGLRLTIVGPPNAGKSSLINALAQRDVAIVSETPGTTRDVIEVRLDLGGYLVHVADTAGLRDTDDAIEAEGVRRALARAEASDLVLLLRDGTDSVYGISWHHARSDGVEQERSAGLSQSAMGFALSLKSGEGLAELIAALDRDGGGTAGNKGRNARPDPAAPSPGA